jgi:hypothetical protein
MLRHRGLRCRHCHCCCQAGKPGWQTMPRHCHSCRRHRHHCHCCASKQGTADNAKAPSAVLPLPLPLHEQTRERWLMMPRHHHLHRHHRHHLCMSEWRTADNAEAPPSAPPLLSSSSCKGATNHQQCQGTGIRTATAANAVIARASMGRTADDANDNGYRDGKFNSGWQ